MSPSPSASPSATGIAQYEPRASEQDFSAHSRRNEATPPKRGRRTVPAEQTTEVVWTCHATRASITPAAPATLTQPTHDLAPGAAHAARGDIRAVVYLTPSSDSRGYAECI